MHINMFTYEHPVSTKEFRALNHQQIRERILEVVALCKQEFEVQGFTHVEGATVDVSINEDYNTTAPEIIIRVSTRVFK